MYHTVKEVRCWLLDVVMAIFCGSTNLCFLFVCFSCKKKTRMIILISLKPNFCFVCVCVCRGRGLRVGNAVYCFGNCVRVTMAPAEEPLEAQPTTWAIACPTKEGGTLSTFPNDLSPLPLTKTSLDARHDTIFFYNLWFLWQARASACLLPLPQACVCM